jgi:hypothetical protein
MFRRRTDVVDISGLCRICSAKKFRDCIRIAALLRERVLRLAFDSKIPRDAEFTLR